VRRTRWRNLPVVPKLAASSNPLARLGPSNVRGDDGAGRLELLAMAKAACKTRRRHRHAAGRSAGTDHGSHWPFAPTLFDYINRAMPMPAPHTLPADDVYALTAYILNLNDIVSGDFVADRDSLPKVKMPNRDHFFWTDPRPDTDKACMSTWVAPADVRITSTAKGRKLAPRTTDPLDTMQGE